MIACSAGNDASQQQQQLSYLQSCGFGRLWRFAGPFTVSRQNPDNVELFVNCLEAMVETCPPRWTTTKMDPNTVAWEAVCWGLTEVDMPRRTILTPFDIIIITPPRRQRRV